MKFSKLFLFVLVFIFSAKVHAQTPQSINYQAVVRDAGGIVVVNKVVGFRLSILTGSSTGNAQYIETHSATTNAFGLVTLNIGLGTPTLGTMSNVAWATGSKFLRVEVDINGGTNFTVLGTTQFLSVPFALYAATSGSSSAASGWLSNGNTTTTANYIGTNNLDDLRFYTEGSQKMVLKTNGNVGIGTQTPESKLTIQNIGDGTGETEDRILLKLNNKSTSFAASTNLQLTGGNSSAFTMFSHISPTYTVANQADYGQIWNTGKGVIIRASPSTANPNHPGNIRFYTGYSSDTYNNLSSNERMRVEANGNVGIGTTTPDARLVVESNGDGFGETDDRFLIKVKNKSTSSASQAIIQVSAGSGNNFMNISQSASNYSISEKADASIVYASGTGGLVLQASPKNGSEVDNSGIHFYTGWVNVPGGSLERMTLDKTGNLGIGTITPKAKLEVTNGDVYVNNSTKGIILKSPNGGCWRVTIDNTGNFVRTAITCPN